MAGRPRSSRWAELPDGLDLVLLGVNGGGAAIFAADPGPDAGAALRPKASLVGLRDVAAMSALARRGGLLAYATALLNWHRRHRFCALCGAPDRAPRGRVRARLPEPAAPSTIRAPTRS